MSPRDANFLQNWSQKFGFCWLRPYFRVRILSSKFESIVQGSGKFAKIRVSTFETKFFVKHVLHSKFKNISHKVGQISDDTGLVCTDCDATLPYVHDNACVADCAALTDADDVNLSLNLKNALDTKQCVEETSCKFMAQGDSDSCYVNDVAGGNPCPSGFYQFLSKDEPGCGGGGVVNATAVTAATNPECFIKTCVDSCPTESPYRGLNGECVSACPTEAPYVHNGECVSTCPTEAPYVDNGDCVSDSTDPTDSAAG